MSNNQPPIGKVLGELEAEIMEIVWNSDDAVSVHSVANAVQRKRKAAYTTVMTVMNRLVEKGLLSRQLKGQAYLYHSTLSKDKFLIRISRQIIRNFISNFGEAAIAHFAEEVDKLSPQKRKQLQRVLKDSQRKK